MAKDLRVTPLKGVTLETTTLSAIGARTQSFADWNGLGRRIGWITSQQSALQSKDLTWKENRSRSPPTRITSTSLSVTTAPFGDSPSTPMVPHGISCRASRNHRANLRVPVFDCVLS